MSAPGVLDYGVMAVGSTVEKMVTIKNCLSQHTTVTFEVYTMYMYILW